MTDGVDGHGNILVQHGVFDSSKDYCIGCRRKLRVLGVEEWRDCWSCTVWNWILLLLTIVSVCAIVGYAMLEVPETRKTNTTLIGICVDIIGAYLLAGGYGEAMAINAASFGGGDSIALKQWAKRGTTKRHFGILLMLLGFLLQGLANFL